MQRMPIVSMNFEKWNQILTENLKEICYNCAMLYIDILFLINSLLDFVLLFTLALWKREPFILKRAIIASFVGGAWACLVAIARIKGDDAVELFTMYPIAYLMIKIGFPNKRQKRSLVVQFFIIAWIGGGILNFLYYKLWHLQDTNNIGSRIVVMIVVWLMALICILKHQQSKLKEQELSVVYTVELIICGKKIKIKALWDSGNRLQDASGEPVCIVENQVMERLMQEQWESLNNWTMADGTFLLEMGFQLIVYHCIGNDKGVFPAIRGEQIVIQTEKGEVIIKNPIIGYCNNTFSTVNENTYEMILPSAYGVQLKQ